MEEFAPSSQSKNKDQRISDVFVFSTIVYSLIFDYEFQDSEYLRVRSCCLLFVNGGIRPEFVINDHRSKDLRSSLFFRKSFIL